MNFSKYTDTKLPIKCAMKHDMLTPIIIEQ